MRKSGLKTAAAVAGLTLSGAAFGQTTDPGTAPPKAPDNGTLVAPKEKPHFNLLKIDANGRPIKQDGQYVYVKKNITRDQITDAEWEQLKADTPTLLLENAEPDAPKASKPKASAPGAEKTPDKTAKPPTTSTPGADAPRSGSAPTPSTGRGVAPPMPPRNGTDQQAARAIDHSGIDPRLAGGTTGLTKVVWGGGVIAGLGVLIALFRNRRAIIDFIPNTLEARRKRLEEKRNQPTEAETKAAKSISNVLSVLKSWGPERELTPNAVALAALRQKSPAATASKITPELLDVARKGIAVHAFSTGNLRVAMDAIEGLSKPGQPVKPYLGNLPSDVQEFVAGEDVAGEAIERKKSRRKKKGDETPPEPTLKDTFAKFGDFLNNKWAEALGTVSDPTYTLPSPDTKPTTDAEGGGRFEETGSSETGSAPQGLVGWYANWERSVLVAADKYRRENPLPSHDEGKKGADKAPAEGTDVLYKEVVEGLVRRTTAFYVEQLAAVITGVDDPLLTAKSLIFKMKNDPWLTVTEKTAPDGKIGYFVRRKEASPPTAPKRGDSSVDLDPLDGSGEFPAGDDPDASRAG